jgi:hypothetical protein
MATVMGSLPEPPGIEEADIVRVFAWRQSVAAKDGHRVEHLTDDKSLEVASELREVLGTQVSFAPSKAVAGQHRAAGAVQSLTMGTQAIRDGEITALHAAAAVPRHIRAASPLLRRGAVGLGEDR